MTAYWTIRARLLRVPGVANVGIWGERLQMLQVQADPERMRDNGVTLEQVMETTADAVDAGLLRYSDGSVRSTGGFVETPNQELVIRHVPAVLTPADLGQVPVKGKPTLKLSDVAVVAEGHQPLAEVSSDIKEKLYRESMESRYDRWLKEDLRSKYDVEILL
mgnify:CR=1 FL=1